MRDPKKVQYLGEKNQKYWAYPRFEEENVKAGIIQHASSRQGDRFSKAQQDFNFEESESFGEIQSERPNQKPLDLFPDPLDHMIGFFVLPPQMGSSNTPL